MWEEKERRQRIEKKREREREYFRVPTVKKVEKNIAKQIGAL